jgi:hypothetical protein
MRDCMPSRSPNWPGTVARAQWAGHLTLFVLSTNARGCATIPIFPKVLLGERRTVCREF